jgi:hypothetical protein
MALKPQANSFSRRSDAIQLVTNCWLRGSFAPTSTAQNKRPVRIRRSKCRTNCPFRSARRHHARNPAPSVIRATTEIISRLAATEASHPAFNPPAFCSPTLFCPFNSGCWRPSPRQTVVEAAQNSSPYFAERSAIVKKHSPNKFFSPSIAKCIWTSRKHFEFAGAPGANSDRCRRSIYVGGAARAVAREFVADVPDRSRQ